MWPWVTKLECGPMPNVMAALPNTGGALCSCFILTELCRCVLVQAALRFLRRMIGLKDDFYNRYIVKCDLLKPVTDAFVSNGLTTYNLFNSAVIELFEFILAVCHLFMAALCNRRPLCFCPVISIFFYLSFFPRLISSAVGWMSTIL